MSCKSQDQATENKDKTVLHAQEQKKPEDVFVACHPDSSDMSPKGSKFVSLTPGAPVLNILIIDKEQKQTRMDLPRPAHDVLMISEDKAILTFGVSGEIAIADIKEGQVSAPIKVGGITQGMCRLSTGQVAIADSGANQVHLFDTKTKKVVHSYPIEGSPSQMRWVTEGIELEAADAKGKTLGKVNLSQVVTDEPS